MINKVSLLECLRELADERFQERVWSGSAPDQMSSFPELVCQTFDDTGLSDAQRGGLVEGELGAEVASLLQRLEAAVDRVQQDQPVDRLIKSQPMCEVRRVSRLIVGRLGGGQ